MPEFEHAISSNDSFHLQALPAEIVIQGGGYTAVEFACIFAGLGSRVKLVYRGENILRGFDDDVRSHVRTEMEMRGIEVIVGDLVTAIDKRDARYTVTLTGGPTISAHRFMFPVGRKPTIAKLGLH